MALFVRWTARPLLSRRPFVTGLGGFFCPVRPYAAPDDHHHDDQPSFDDHEMTFRSKTTWEVFRAYIVYQLCSYDYVVDNHARLLIAGRAMLGDRLFCQLMKLTFYGHFVAGEDGRRAAAAVRRLRLFGVESILDYSAEGCGDGDRRSYPDHYSAKGRGRRSDRPQSGRPNVLRRSGDAEETACERNAEAFHECVLAAASSVGGTGIAAVKMTALGQPRILYRLSREIVNARVSDGCGPGGAVRPVTRRGLLNDRCEPNEEYRVPCPRRNLPVPLLSVLSPAEAAMFRNAARRLSALARAARDLGVRLMVDAEQTHYQPAISRLTMELMCRYNADGEPVVYNTYQCYLRDAIDELRAGLDQAEAERFRFGVKLVRGAYIEQERARAARLGLADPTYPTYEATTAAFHEAIVECLSRARQPSVIEGRGGAPRVAVMVASHNENTVRFTLSRMRDAGILPDGNIVCFGQLFGMCDFITFPLGVYLLFSAARLFST